MEAVRFLSLVSALFVLVAAGYFLGTYTTTATRQSTFSLQPGLTAEFSLRNNLSESMAGHFEETLGRPVSFYIQTSAQFAAFQSGTSFDYVYSVTNTSSSDVSYGFSAQGPYYLTFTHGTGLDNSTETVYFQRTYTAHDSSRLLLGLVFLPIVAVDLVYGFRRRVPEPADVPA